MHEILHKNAIEKVLSLHFYASLYDGSWAIEQICYSFTLLISYMFVNPFKMAVWFFRMHQDRLYFGKFLLNFDGPIFGP